MAKTSKKGASKKPAGPGKLPEGIKTALAIALNEVFYENVDRAVEDPDELLESGDLGATFQGYHRGVVDQEKSVAYLKALEPWLSSKIVVRTLDRAIGDSALEFASDLIDAAALEAAVEMAEAIVLLATNKPKRVKERVRPWVESLQPFAERLAQKIADGDTDEDDAIVDELEGR